MDAPIVKATLQAGALAVLSNLLAQGITAYRKNSPFNPSDLTYFVLFTLLNCPPNYLWQAWLEAQFPAYASTAAALSPAEKEKLVDDIVIGADEASKETTATRIPTTASASTPRQHLSITNTAVKFTLDQTLGAAVNTVVYLAGMALLKGKGWEVAVEEVRKGFWPLIFAGQKLWPWVSVVSFAVVPVEYRMVFGSVVGVFWGVWLCLM